MNEWCMEKWLTDAEINEMEYSPYWNDEEVEKSKNWYIVDGDFSKMAQYLQKTGLLQDLTRCVKILRTDFKRALSGVGIDLAAGNLWAAPQLLTLGAVHKLYCLEYSRHRLLKIGPLVLEHYRVPKEKIVLVLGSFYDLHLQDHSLDFVFMSQAFHHASQPEQILKEIRRVLKPHGVVMIIGEHLVDYHRAQMKHAVKFLISTLIPNSIQKKIWGNPLTVKTLRASLDQLFPFDPISGDHYYTAAEYRSMFSTNGFQIKHFKNYPSRFQSFVLVAAPK